MKNRLFDQQGGSSNQKAHLIGVGLDNEDGHKRLTKAERFSVVGGCEETHDKITATLMKTFEHLDRKGKALEQAEPQELSDIIRKSAESL